MRVVVEGESDKVEIDAIAETDRGKFPVVLVSEVGIHHTAPPRQIMTVDSFEIRPSREAAEESAEEFLTDCFLRACTFVLNIGSRSIFAVMRSADGPLGGTGRTRFMATVAPVAPVINDPGVSNVATASEVREKYAMDRPNLGHSAIPKPWLSADCPECKGSGEYRGLNSVELCSICFPTESPNG